MLRIEQRNAATPVERKPEWIKAKVQMGPEFVQLKNLVKKEGLHTVCEEAGCPNIFECWEDKEATFLIGGSECTRRCDFCQIDTGKPSPVDMFEPTKVARSVQAMALRYATVTGVARDDLADEGVWLYAETVRKIHELNPGTGVELLIPDFSGKPEHIAAICDSKPEVFAHNVETVPRIFKRIRPAFRYDRSLDVITQGRKLGMVTKSNLILGMGETREEISEALRDLHEAGCDLITITQYLRPSERHLPVDRWVKPQEFVDLQNEADEIGFLGVMSGPLVRSSYRAGRLWATAMRKKGWEIPAELAHIESSGSTRQEASSLLGVRPEQPNLIQNSPSRLPKIESERTKDVPHHDLKSFLPRESSKSPGGSAADHDAHHHVPASPRNRADHAHGRPAQSARLHRGPAPRGPEPGGPHPAGRHHPGLCCGRHLGSVRGWR